MDKPKTAISNISIGKEKKEDMLISQYHTVYEKLFSIAPLAIYLFGELVLLSSKSDVRLTEKTPEGGFKFLHQPESFTTCLVQISRDMWSAFDEAQTEMDKISLCSSSVEMHVKNTVKFLMGGKPDEMEMNLPVCLKTLCHAGEVCLEFAVGIEEKFSHLIDVTDELLEASKLAKSSHERKEYEYASKIRMLHEMDIEMRNKTEQDINILIFDKIQKAPEGVLEAVIEHWQKLLKIFQIFSNLIKCCLQGFIKDFVELAKDGHKLVKANICLSGTFRDLIFHQAMEVNRQAFTVQFVSSSYVMLSSQHLMDKITDVNQLFSVNPRNYREISTQLYELNYRTTEASQAIQSIMRKHREEFEQQEEGRIRRFERELEYILPPEKLTLIQETVTKGTDENFEKELDDLL